MAIEKVVSVSPKQQGFSSNSLVSDEAPTGSVNGSNKVFTTTFAFAPNTAEVFVNGLKQARVLHYTETGSNQITLDVAPLTGDIVRVNYIKA